MIKRKRKASDIVLEVVLIVASLIIVVPLAIMILGSLKTPSEALLFNLKIPTEWRFDNYLFVLKESNVLRSFFNSLLITASSVSIIIISSMMCAFFISRRRKQRLSKALYNLFLLGMVVNFISRFTDFGWLDAILAIGVFILWIMGLFSAIQGKEQSVPLLGDQFQEWFRNIG